LMHLVCNELKVMLLAYNMYPDKIVAIVIVNFFMAYMF